MNNHNKYLKMCVEIARKGIDSSEGGPFGSVIVNKNGKVLACTHNTVLKNNNPTQHAEINAISEASKHIEKLEDLKQCTLYCNAQPCLMCMSAIIWAEIGTVVFSTTIQDTEKIGFAKEDILELIKKFTKSSNYIKLESKEALELLDYYNHKQDKTIY